MKKVMVTLAVLLVTGCAKQEMYDVVDVKTPHSEGVQLEECNQFASLLEKARWGNGKAYLELAKCYHDGIGVQPDFVRAILMLSMADQYGEIRGFNCFMTSLPNTDTMRMVYETIEKNGSWKHEKGDSVADALIANNVMEGHVLKGILQIGRGDTLGVRKTMEEYAEKGCSLADVVLCAWYALGKEKDKSQAIEQLIPLADRTPLACKLLGDFYSGYEGVEYINEPLAEKYYMKIDEQGLLGRRPARWLINYYERKGVQVAPREMERLRILSGNTSEEYVPDSVKIDADCLEVDTVAVK